mgnify:CR=1 FL=1
MALTKASLIDLNANELILDLDADTSITADTDDTIHFKIGGTDRVTIAGSALSPASSDGSSLGTTALEWSDLFLADGAVINFGDDQDVSLTHVADTGLLLSSTDQLQFGDSGTYIHQSADGVLDLVSDTEIEINATTIDMNGALDVSGTITSGGVITGTGFTIGSAVIAEAELELLDGLTAGTAIASKVVTTDANIDTTGQRNLTISGELDAATLDISGNADIDGTLETDALSINGTAVTSTAAELNILDGKSFVDEDNMASNSATAIASQQSIKAYVDGQISGVSTAPFLFTADDEGSGSINLTNEDRLTIRGGTGVSTVTTSGTIVTINVDNTILTTTTGSTKGFAIAQAVALG